MVLVSDLDPSALSLVYLVIKPCITETTTKKSNCTTPSILAAAVKVHLLKWCCEGLLTRSSRKPLLRLHFTGSNSHQIHSLRRGKIYEETDSDLEKLEDPNEEFLVPGVLWLPQLDPNLFERWPCECHGYVKTVDVLSTAARHNVIVTEATMVRVLPLHADLTDHLTGEIAKPIGRSSINLANHNPESIRELAISLKRLMIEPVMIGTAPTNSDDGMIHPTRQWSPPRCLEFKRDGALLVRSAHHGAGKTQLVEHLARKIGCRLVHIVQVGPIIAKHGVHADMALETILHQSVLDAAIENKSICIILDHFSSMIPSKNSATSNAGDAASQVLRALAASLRMLTHSLYHDKVFPFPVKNRLYNVHATKGHYIPVRLCLVAVDTEDAQNLPSNERGGRSTSISDSLVARSYYFPTLTTKTRLTAFQTALKEEGLYMSPDLREELPYLAASAVWARGIHFQQVARHVRHQEGSLSPPTTAHFVVALQQVRKSNAISGADVEVLARKEDLGTRCFAAVGGHPEAKAALEEALALDERKKRIMRFFGMEPPTGVLLYGPPGCGKTLMAKAVAKMLKSDSVIGGAFVSINSTDVARAEVGTGEKILVGAFENARANAPAVVFIDEFQALFTDRSTRGTSRLTSTLLAAMDDCKSWAELDKAEHRQKWEKKRVIILGATNTPWMVDMAFLRPGRFDRIVHVGLPREEERYCILELLIRSMKTSFERNVEELQRVCEHVARLTQGFSGADLAALCRTAAVQCLLENGSLVDQAHFDRALQGSQPSCSAGLVQRIERWRLQSSE